MIYELKIFKSVILFITSLFLSALFMRDDASLLGRLQLSFDYAFLFFITLFCLNTVKDIQTLIQKYETNLKSIQQNYVKNKDINKEK